MRSGSGSVVDRRDLWAALEALTDPEIPVLTLREMGILRDLRELAAAGEGSPVVEVVITPTYSGCPALDQIEADVLAALGALHIDARVVVRLAPAWSTDWLSETARNKLRLYGIAPPNGLAPVLVGPDGSTSANIGAEHEPALGTVRLRRNAARVLADTSVPCPRCGSDNTTETSHFGSTACKALFRCLACLEPFDHFKPH
jgi:ring-1,2-phenylacetyl-CoA epoxidase subunit PaaD